MPQEQWISPQLIVLGRGRPEEQVLCACKTACKGGPGQNRCESRYHRDCRYNAKS